MEFVLPPWSPKGWPFRWGRPFRCVGNQMGVGVGSLQQCKGVQVQKCTKVWRLQKGSSADVQEGKGFKCRRTTAQRANVLEVQEGNSVKGQKGKSAKGQQCISAEGQKCRNVKCRRAGGQECKRAKAAQRQQRNTAQC